MVLPLYLSLFLVFLLSGNAFSSQDLEGRAVVAIEFSPDRQLLFEGHRKDLLAVDVGRPLDLREIRKTIRDLYATGRYAMIEVQAFAEGEGVKLVFVTEPNWFIGQVDVLGVDPPPTVTQLINVTTLEPGELYTEDRIATALAAIRRLLQDNGFDSASVTVDTLDHPGNQQRDIAFRVTPSARAGIGRIILTGENDLSEAQARSITDWREGKEFTDQRIKQGLESLRRHFQEQDYWQVRTRTGGFVFQSDRNLMDIVLEVDRGPKVLVAVEGADFSQRQLRRYLPIYSEGVVDADLLAEGARNLRDYLQTEGYFSSAVEPLQETRNANGGKEILIIYDIDRGPRHRLARIQITGNRFFDTGTVRERMLIQERSWQLRRGRFSQSLLERDIDAITELYRSNGFRAVKITSRVQDDYLGKDGDLAVFITIEEGPITLVEHVALKGAEQIPAERFLPRLALAPGQPFSEVNVATDRNLILAEYFDEGYRDASLTWRSQPGAEPNRMIVEFAIREGQPLFMRYPIVSGLVHTKPHLVEKQIQLRTGEPLSQTNIFDTQRRLYDLGIFSQVDVALQNPEGEEPAKNVLLQVEEARRWSLGLGGGAEFARIGGNTADPTSPIGNASFSPRVTIEVTRLNFRGIGHTLNLRTRFSNLQQRALFAYEAPRWTGSEKWHMTVSALLDTSRNVRTYTGNRAETAFQLRHRLSKPSTAFYRYTFRRTSIDEETLQIDPILIPLAAQPVRVALVSGTYIQDRRDDPTDSTRGVYNTLDLSFASGVWGSEPDFARLIGQNSTYHRLGSKLVLARTFQLGLMFAAGSFPSLDPDTPASIEPFSIPDPRIPLSERYYAGGANSHRGFPVNQAGPRDATTGFPIGGGAQLLNSVELRFPLLGENIGGVLFHDAGNVYSRPGAISLGSHQRSFPGEETPVFNFDYMVHAVGLGVRYRTPIGPIRLDLAYSLNPPRFIGFEGTREQLLRGEGGMRTQQRISHFHFHFSLGQTF